MRNELNIHKKLTNPFEAPAFEKDCYPRCADNRADPKFELSRKMLHRAHWPVDLSVDIDGKLLSEELERVDREDWCAYDNDPLGVRGAGKSTYWQAKFIRNFSEQDAYGFGDSRAYLTKESRLTEVEDGHCKRSALMQTSAWDKLPYISSLAQRFVTLNHCNRILLSRVDSEGRINWHSHIRESEFYTYMYLHIPLRTESSCRMLVLRDGRIEHEHYPVGTAWVLNTQHNHAVSCNQAAISRVHLLILAHLDDPKFSSLLENSMSRYPEYRPQYLDVGTGRAALTNCE